MAPEILDILSISAAEPRPGNNSISPDSNVTGCAWLTVGETDTSKQRQDWRYGTDNGDGLVVGMVSVGGGGDYGGWVVVVGVVGGDTISKCLTALITKST